MLIRQATTKHLTGEKQTCKINYKRVGGGNLTDKPILFFLGTPALSRPIELYSQISAIQPKLFKNSFEFGLRYCDAQQKKFGMKDVWDYSGSSNMQELSLLLQVSILICFYQSIYHYQSIYIYQSIYLNQSIYLY